MYYSWRCFLFIITMLLTSNVFAQVKDIRAELAIEGLVKEVSVSPNEKIWLTGGHVISYTNSMDSNWHYAKALYAPKDDYDYGGPKIKRISFFNEDTAIMTGYISASKDDMKKNGYYLTMDGGKTWKLLDFGGDAWIYDIYVNSKGHAWMGGSSGNIHYSKDYGQHWEKLNSPYNSSTRTHYIFMKSNTEGISCALGNGIYQTSDNWNSSKKIETPLDQKKYANKNNATDDRVEKVQLWNDYIVVNQRQQIFYTKVDKVDWKKFPREVIAFDLDEGSNTLFAITDSLEIVEFYTPTKYKKVTNERLPYSPQYINVVNHSLYVLGSGVYKVSSKGVEQSFLYTTDRKIADPYKKKNGVNLTWGVSWGGHLYISDAGKGNWYREAVLDFNVQDITLLSDSVAVFWDGFKNNYIYSLSEHKCKKYYPQKTLEGFLSSPLKSFIISSGSQGCFHNFEDEVEYRKINDSTFASRSPYSQKGYSTKRKAVKFSNRVSSYELNSILMSINSNPSEIPALKSFNITEEDKKAYLTLVDKKLKEGETEYYFREGKKIDKDFYYSVPDRLSSLDDSITNSILNQSEGLSSTTRHSFIIQLINENNDTVKFERVYFMNSLPWHLPWKVKSNGFNYNCYNLEFSKFIKSCIPDKFKDKAYFDNSVLIKSIADYLWRNEE